MTNILGFAAVLVAACASPAFDLHASAPAVPAVAGSHVLAIVRIPAPWYAPRFVIARRFRDAVADYEHLPDLVAKAFTIDDDRRFGGIYLWTDRAAATAYYSPAWRAGIRDRRGHDPDLVMFDAPFVVRGRTVIHGDPIDARATRFPATATLVISPGTPDGAAALAARISQLDGLIAGAVVVGDGTLGYVGLWARRELAEAAVGPDATYFDAPVLML
ncbi:MAG TPA: hypothetical protein VGO00_23265 [Kofleriaceae bacterium]|jgi:hypothetical protein|nr:hypothetical protein [Kofleriaceae bacterium]